jgi:hypothetical protein
MRENDLIYSRRRADEEAARSLSLHDPVIAAVHSQLARAYRQRVVDLTNHRQPTSTSL